MANKKVTLLRYCKTESGWRRFPVVIGKTGKVRPDAVLANGQERIYPEGYYCIRTYLGDKPQYTNVGTDPAEALQKQQREEKLLTARDSAQVAGIEIVEPSVRKTLREYSADFLYQKSLEPHRSRDTMDGYSLILRDFIAGCAAEFPEQIEAVDVLRYCAGVEKQGLSPRTRANRFGSGRCRACRGTGELEENEPRSLRRPKLHRFEFPGPQFYGIWRYQVGPAVMRSAKPTTEAETVTKPDPAPANPECAADEIWPCSPECWRPCDRCHKLICEKHDHLVPVWPSGSGACEPADMVCRQCIAELWDQGDISQSARVQYLY